MTKKFIKSTILIFYMLFNISVLASPEKYNDQVVESITHTDFYKNVAISSVERRKNQEFIDRKININAIELKPADENLSPLSVPTPTLGKIIWTITANQLLVTEDQCNEETMDLCDENYTSCFKPCLRYGPEVVSFDEKANKLYVTISTTAAGSTGKGPHFIFVADLNKKEIKPLLVKPISRPAENSLSPQGRYLLTIGYNSNYITIIDTKAGTAIEVGEENILKPGHQRLHYAGDMKWLSENRFSYQEGISYGESKDSLDEIKEHIYDMPTKKIIRSRTLDKSEYQKS